MMLTLVFHRTVFVLSHKVMNCYIIAPSQKLYVVVVFSSYILPAKGHNWPRHAESRGDPRHLPFFIRIFLGFCRSVTVFSDKIKI